MSNILIVYFSRAGENYVAGGIQDLPVGNTEVVAKTIGKLTGAPLFRITPLHAYPRTYGPCVEVARQEQGSGARPELAAQVDQMDAYDTILLGYPNWCGTMPMPMWTFLEAYDFAGKTIFPFCTHEGSGLGHSEADIKTLCPRTAVKRGLAIRGSEAHHAEDSLRAWLQDLL